MNAETATVEENGVQYTPATLLAVGEKRKVKGSAKDPYVQKRQVSGYYTCTCPSWRYLKGEERTRSCSHLRTLLGEEYEKIRTRQARMYAPSSSSTATRKRRGASENDNLASKPINDPDVFPHAQSAQSSQIAKRARTLQGAFNERNNGGPRDMNGGKNLLLAHPWPEKKDPTGYWLSEKLDGVRAWWDGKQMFARSGRFWNPPPWFVARLPKDLHLDGELWSKRDNFDTTSGICRSSSSEGWHTINFMVFDITNVSLLYEERLRELKRRLPDGEKSPDEVVNGRLGGLICVLPAIKCTGKRHFDDLMRQVIDLGGEGLMLREPCSAYIPGRNGLMYKQKYWYDAEGLVVGHEWGQGEHRGRMGAIRVEMENGTMLKVGSGFSHAQREMFQPPVGAIIRYRFQELSHDGQPRFPIYEGTCPDKHKPCDAIVRSAKFRAEAKTEKLKDFMKNVDAETSAASPSSKMMAEPKATSSKSTL